MKKLFTLLLLCSSLQAFGQLTLVREMDTQFTPFRLANGNWMLYSVLNMNNKYQSITFYNNDFSVYKVVNLSQVFPHDTTGYKNNYLRIANVGVFLNDDDPETAFAVSNNFFNSDEKIEIIISYRSTQNSNSLFYSRSTDLIIDEDGKELQRFTNLNGDIQYGYWKYLNVTFSENEKELKTKIFSIPGNLPCPTSCSQKAAGIMPITQPNEFKEIQVNGFPNPSSDKVTLAYSLPEGISFGTLRLYTQTGELVKEFKVSSQVDHLELPVSDYTPGTYYYELQAGGNTSGGKKMVVIH